MKVLDVLIFGERGSDRDYYELELLRRHLEVMACSTVAEAVEIIEQHLIKILALIGSSLDPSRNDLLRLAQIRQAVIPVFFLPEAPHQLLRESNHAADSDAIELIPELVHLVQLAAGPHHATESSTERKRAAIAIKRREFPIRHADAIAAFEAEWMAEILKRCHGNISRAAREMGIARRSLQLRIQSYGINLDLMRKQPLA